MDSMIDSLGTLVSRFGPQTLERHEDLHSALADLMPHEGSCGERNLVVAAVSSGSIARLRQLMAEGAEPARAVEDAASVLAGELYADPRSARWACAVVGEALGIVPHSLVEELEPSARPGSRDVGPTAERPSMTTASATVLPAAGPGLTPAQETKLAPSRPRPRPVPHPHKERSRPPWWGLVLRAVVAVLLAAGSGALALLAVGAGDPVTQRPLSAVAVEGRYADLGAALLSDSSSCDRGTPRPGERERVRCTVDGVEVRLVTYENEVELARHRTRVVGDARSNESPRGTYAERNNGDGTATVYWDAVAGRQSALAVGSGDVYSLRRWWDDRAVSTVARLADPGDAFRSADLRALGARFYKTTRTPRCSQANPATLGITDGSVAEAVVCSNGRGVQVEYYRTHTREDLLGWRDAYPSLDTVRPGTRNIDGWTRESEPGRTQGTLMQYVDVSGAAALYWDLNASPIFARAVRPDGDRRALYRFWTGHL
jgi:hypothetical protein